MSWVAGVSIQATCFGLGWTDGVMSLDALRVRKTKRCRRRCQQAAAGNQMANHRSWILLIRGLYINATTGVQPFTNSVLRDERKLRVFVEGVPHRLLF